MKIELEPGKYVVAVSGGVDSMVLLDLMAKHPGLELIVAHLDHGMRADSGEDHKLVEKAAQSYGLKLEAEETKLGSQASEETARKTRYGFLRKVQKKYAADAIITAHHQDDLLETAAINIIRGTGPKGLSSLSSRPGLVRPLLGFSKEQLKKYAIDNHIEWREDPTNKDTKYLRNYLRHEVLSKLNSRQRQDLLQIIEGSSESNAELTKAIQELRISLPIDRLKYNSLPHNVSKEVIGDLLRERRIYFDAKTLERLSVQLKTKPSGNRLDITAGWYFLIEKQQISLHQSK